MTIKLLLVFAITEFLLSLTPGPAVLLIVSQGVKAGFKPSIRGTLGILMGNAIYFAISALGLGALLIASANLFQAIKWIGVSYLVFVGLKMLFSRSQPESEEQKPEIKSKSSLRLFSQGLITQLSNPKAIIFFSALLPQFISTGQSMPYQVLILGFVSISVEFPVLVSYGWLAERGTRLIPQKYSSIPDRVAGGFLVSAGIGLALTKRP